MFAVSGLYVTTSLDSFIFGNDLHRGPGVIVQADESCFSHKPKHHRGRGPQKTQWVFGIVDTSTSRFTGYLEMVDTRDTETLLPIINSVVEPGSVVPTDEWRAYRGIMRMGLEHTTVNHSVNFVEPDSGVHTQHIESYWNRKKKTIIKRMLGCHRSMLHWYLQEFMWRDRFDQNSDAFVIICEHINLFYSFNN